MTGVNIKDNDSLYSASRIDTLWIKGIHGNVSNITLLSRLTKNASKAILQVRRTVRKQYECFSNMKSKRIVFG